MQHDQERIERSPESFVLFEDIEHLLQIYRDNGNLQLLVDMFVEQLGFPPVFSPALQVDGEFAGRYVYRHLKRTFATNEFSRICTGDRLDAWSNYFHPQEAELLLGSSGHVRLLYLKRVLYLLKDRMQNTRPILNYLMFLEATIYVNPKLVQLLYRDKPDQCKDEISNLLQLQPNNVELWFAYVEAEHLKNGNTEECCGVYQQLFKLEGLTRKRVYLVLFNFYASLKRWKVARDAALIPLLTFLRDQRVPSATEDKSRMSMFDILQLQHLLLTRYQELEDSKPSARHQQPHRATKRHIVSYFILEMCRNY